MAAKKIAYIGGGSSRAAGTMASFMHKGEEFNGSHYVLIDKDADRLELVRRIAVGYAKEYGLDVTIETTTNQREGLRDVDAVLTSYRPGNFEMRLQDELIPMRHGVIGQETQGPGGMMMAFRSITDMKTILDDLDAVAKDAVIFNYTNPINIVSQAVTTHSDRTIWSMCEGPINFWHHIVETAGLEIDRCHVVMSGVNHNCWSTVHTYDGQDMMPLLEQGYERVKDDPTVNVWSKRMLHLAVAMQSIPADYMKYYYFDTEVFRDWQSRRRTRAQELIDAVPGYFAHYAEQAASEHPQLDPSKSRGGIHELELAIDVMSAYYNDTPNRLPVNLPNKGGVLDGFDEDTVVEVWCTVDGSGVHPEGTVRLPDQVMGITQTLAECQRLAAKAAWDGDRRDAVRAFAAHPFVRNLDVAEELYDEMAWANRDYLPERLTR